MPKCRLCKEETENCYLMLSKLIPICENCTDTIFKGGKIERRNELLEMKNIQIRGELAGTRAVAHNLEYKVAELTRELENKEKTIDALLDNE